MDILIFVNVYKTCSVFCRKIKAKPRYSQSKKSKCIGCLPVSISVLSLFRRYSAPSEQWRQWFSRSKRSPVVAICWECRRVEVVDPFDRIEVANAKQRLLTQVRNIRKSVSLALFKSQYCIEFGLWKLYWTPCSVYSCVFTNKLTHSHLSALYYKLLRTFYTWFFDWFKWYRRGVKPEEMSEFNFITIIYWFHMTLADENVALWTETLLKSTKGPMLNKLAVENG